MRSFSRQLRDVAHRSFAALRPHRYEDVYAVDAASTSMHVLLPEDNSDHLVKINLSHGSHDSSEVNSASSSSSSLEMLDKPAVRFAHVPLEDPDVTAAIPVCRRIRDPPPNLDDFADASGTTGNLALNPLTGTHPLAPPPHHSRSRQHVVQPSDSGDNVSSDAVCETCDTPLLGAPLRFPF